MRPRRNKYATTRYPPQALKGYIKSRKLFNLLIILRYFKRCHLLPTHDRQQRQTTPRSEVKFNHTILKIIDSLKPIIFNPYCTM